MSTPVPAGRIDLVAVELLEDRRSREDASLAALWTALEAVKDPEIPVLSVRELGVLRALRRDGDAVSVVITPTYSGCPAMQTIADDIREALAHAGERDVRIETRLAPAWTTDWIAAEARDRLAAWGIAPPGAAGEPALEAHPCCPRCGSKDTRELSAFGSTACKALWQCGSCAEPFDYFKAF